MPLPDDYAPIVEEHDLEPARGLLGRRRQRQLPPVGRGYERVVIEASGNVISVTTAGTNYWAPGSSWAKVDIGSHDLEYELPVADRYGNGGYIAVVTVTAAIRDASEVVRRRTMGMKGTIVPILREFVTRCCGESARNMSDSADLVLPEIDPIRTLDKSRAAAEDSLRDWVGHEVPAPGWLAVALTSATLRFDANTKSHRDTLLEARRSAEIIRAERAGKLEDLRSESEIRDEWRKILTPQLADPVLRFIEVAVASPNAATVREIAERLDAGDRDVRDVLVQISKVLIDNNFDIRDPDVMARVDEIVRARRPTGAGLNVGPLSLGASRELTEPPDDEQVVTAEVIVDPTD